MLGQEIPGLTGPVMLDVHLLQSQRSPAGAHFEVSLVLGPWGEHAKFLFRLSSLLMVQSSLQPKEVPGTEGGKISAACAEEKHDPL